MIKIDAKALHKNRHTSEKKAILLTGAHHSRELVSVQMPLYTVVDLLHRYVHKCPERTELLRRNKYFVIPFVNTDGSHTIMEEFNRTGEVIYKRKNNDRSMEYKMIEEGKGEECPLWLSGTDINRNYGYLWGNKDTPC